MENLKTLGSICLLFIVSVSLILSVLIADGLMKSFPILDKIFLYGFMTAALIGLVTIVSIGVVELHKSGGSRSEDE